jgi:hypothetical protein
MSDAPRLRVSVASDTAPSDGSRFFQLLARLAAKVVPERKGRPRRKDGPGVGPGPKK